MKRETRETQRVFLSHRTTGRDVPRALRLSLVCLSSVFSFACFFCIYFWRFADYCLSLQQIFHGTRIGLIQQHKIGTL